MKFHAEKIRGCHLFRASFDSLPLPESDRLRAVAQFLDVTPGTVRRWLDGRSDPPAAACAAIWHESALGRSAVVPHSEQRAAILHGLCDALKRENAALLATIEQQARELADLKRSDARSIGANDPIYDPRTPTPTGRRRYLA